MRCVLIAWLFPVLACAMVVHGAESEAAPAKAQASAGAEPTKASPAARAQAAEARSPEAVVLTRAGHLGRDGKALEPAACLGRQVVKRPGGLGARRAPPREGGPVASDQGR